MKPKEDKFEKSIVIEKEMWKKMEEYCNSVNLTTGIKYLLIYFLK